MATLTPKPVSFLLICHSYPPVLGGSEIEAQRVCRALIERGHKVTVLCAGLEEMPDQSHWRDPYGVDVRIIGRRASRRWLDRYFALGVAWYLLRHHSEYQLVYFLMQGLHLAAGLPVAKLLGKPVLMKISGSGIITILRQSRLGRLELDWLNRWAHRIMILNEGMREEARQAGLNPAKLFWMPNPVDVEEFSPVAGMKEKTALRESLGLDPAAVIGLFVGRLAPEKELGSAIAAFARASASRPEAQFVIVGDGPQRKELEQQARQLGVRVSFAGRQSMDCVRKYLRTSDYFLLVSSLEGFPCSLVEAMATGLPSVVSSIPANLQLIEGGEQGYTAPVRDEEELAEAMGKMIDDKLARQRMGQTARQLVVDRYSTTQIAVLYEALFASALTGR